MYQHIRTVTVKAVFVKLPSNVYSRPVNSSPDCCLQESRVVVKPGVPSGPIWGTLCGMKLDEVHIWYNCSSGQ